MGTLTQLQQNRRILQDFTSTALALISNPFARLVYLASLRNLATNVYDHPGLTAVYGKQAVQQALQLCHEELFERVLETPLPVQEQDLRAYLSTVPSGPRSAAATWSKLESYRSLLPLQSPDYLKELFCSNVRTILEVIARQPQLARVSPNQPRL